MGDTCRGSSWEESAARVERAASGISRGLGVPAVLMHLILVMAFSNNGQASPLLKYPGAVCRGRLGRKLGLSSSCGIRCVEPWRRMVASIMTPCRDCEVICTEIGLFPMLCSIFI